MKKKISVLCIALCFICLCFLLSSCSLFGSNDNTSSSSPRTPKIEEDVLVVALAEDSKYKEYFENNEISLPDGTSLDFQKVDFTVKAKKSNGTESEFTDYTVQFKETEIGQYVVSVIVGENAVYSIRVNAKPTKLPAVPLSGPSFVYTGEEIDVLATLQFEDGTSVVQLVSDNKVTTDGSLGKATDAGSYIIGLDAADGYCWEENGILTKHVDIVWTITPKEIPLPTVSGDSQYTYDGTVKTLQVDAHGYADIISYMTGNVDSSKGTNVGAYTCVASIRSSAQNNYFFEGYTATDEVNIAIWRIVPIRIPVPVVSGMIPDENGCYHYTYNGLKILPQLVVGDEELVAAIPTGDSIIPIRYGYPTAGVNTVELSYEDYNNVNADMEGTTRSIRCLLDDSGNYAWEGTDDSEVIISYAIDQEQVSLPDDIGSQLKLYYIYSGASLQLNSGDRPVLVSNEWLTACNTLVNTYTYTPGDSDPEEYNPLAVSGFMMGNSGLLALKVNQMETGDFIFNEWMQIYQLTLNDFSWKETVELKEESNIAEVGKTYTAILVYQKDSSQGKYNYAPIEIEVEIEVVKKGQMYSFFTPVLTYSDPEVCSAAYSLDGSYAVAPAYTLDAEGNVVAYLFESSVSPDSISQSVTIMRKIDGVYTEVSDIITPGEYKAYISFSADENTILYYRKGNVFYKTHSFVYDWTIEKRQFSDTGLYSFGHDDTTVTYVCNASYSDPVRGGNPIFVNVTASALVVEYRTNETDTWQILAGPNGNYDLTVPGQYRAIVTPSYDTDNFILVDLESGEVATQILSGVWIVDAQE